MWSGEREHILHLPISGDSGRNLWRNSELGLYTSWCKLRGNNSTKKNLQRNSYIFIQENAFHNVFCEMATILSRPQCVNTRPGQAQFLGALSFVLLLPSALMKENITGVKATFIKKIIIMSLYHHSHVMQVDKLKNNRGEEKAVFIEYMKSAYLTSYLIIFARKTWIHLKVSLNLTTHASQTTMFYGIAVEMNLVSGISFHTAPLIDIIFVANIFTLYDTKCFFPDSVT